jgi:hypothetical protein
MTTSRRIGLSFGCVVFAVFLLMLLGIGSLLVNGALDRTRLELYLQIAPIYVVVALPGWMIAVPFIVMFKDAEGRRALLILVIGTLIGPAFIGGWYGLHGYHFSSEGDRFALAAATVISFLTTVAYVLSLRAMDRRNHRVDLSVVKGEGA